MLAEALDQVVGPGNLPSRQEMGLGPFRLLQAHVVHHRDQVQVNGGDGVIGRAHGKGSLHRSGAVGVLPLQIEIVGLHIQGKGPQPGWQQGQKALGLRQLLRQRQVEQHGGGGRHKHPRRPQVGGLLHPGRKKFLHLVQGKSGVLDLVEGEVGVGIDQAGGQPRPHVRAGEIGPHRPCRLFRLACEVVILRPGDVPPGAASCFGTNRGF